MHPDFCNGEPETAENNLSGQNQIMTIILDGIKSVPQKELQTIIPSTVLSDEANKSEWFKELKNKILDVYGNYGYLQVTVSKYTEDNQIILKIDEGIINSIILSNNIDTPDYMILRELRQKSGDVFNDEIMREDLKRLKKTGYFNNIYYSVSKLTNDNLDITIVIEDSSWLGLGFGWAYSPLMGAMETRLDRLFKTDNSISLYTELYAKGEFAYFLKFYNPWITGNKLSAGIGLFDWYPAYFFDQKNRQLALVKTKGMKCMFGIPLFGDYLTTNWRGIIGLGVAQKAIVDYDFQILPEYSATKNPDGWDLYYFPEITLNYNSIDNLTTPVNGTWGIAQTTLIRGTANALRLKFGWDYYTPVYRLPDERPVTFASLNSCGFYPLGDAIAYQKFFGLGSKGVRGNSELMQSGDNYLNFKQEILFPVPVPIMAQDILWGRVFLDEGIFWDNKDGFNLDKSMFGTGIGIRILTPIGLFNVDYGFNIKDFSQSSFSFNIPFYSYHDDFILNTL